MMYIEMMYKMSVSLKGNTVCNHQADVTSAVM